MNTRRGGNSSGTSGAPAVVDRIRSIHMSPEMTELRRVGFAQILTTGRPIPIDVWASAAQIDVGRIHEILEDNEAPGRIEFDDAGRLVGIAGLTVNPTVHEIHLGRFRRHTWCAFDAVGIMAAARANGAVRSSDPASGEELVIQFADGRPGAGPVVFVLDGYDPRDVVRSWCPSVNFFADRLSAGAWAIERGVTGDIVPVADLAEAAAPIWEPVVGSRTV